MFDFWIVVVAWFVFYMKLNVDLYETLNEWCMRKGNQSHNLDTLNRFDSFQTSSLFILVFSLDCRVYFRFPHALSRCSLFITFWLICILLGFYSHVFFKTMLCTVAVYRAVQTGRPSSLPQAFLTHSFLICLHWFVFLHFAITLKDFGDKFQIHSSYFLKLE